MEINKKIKSSASLSRAALLLMLILSGCMGRKIKYEPLIKSSEAHSTLLIQNVTLFTGLDTFALEKQDVFIRDGLIEWVGDAGTKKFEAEKVLPGNDLFLCPGFTDAHVHLMATAAVPWDKSAPDTRHNLEAFLSCGVTTVFDLGGPSKMMEKLKKKVNAGKLNGPNIFHTHSPVTAPESHPIPSIRQLMGGMAAKLIVKMILTADEVDDAKPIVAELIKQKVDYVKLICDQIPPGSPEMKEEVMKALVDESHAAGYKVFVHTGSPENMMAAVRSGADVIAHMPWRGLLSPESVKEMAGVNVKVICTLAGFDGVAHMCTGNFDPSKMEKDHSHVEVYGPASGADGKKILEQPVLGDFAKEVNANREYWKSNIALLKQFGVKFMIGTDSPIPGAYEGGSFHRELELMNKLGISNADLLIAATSAPAQILPGKNNWGTIEPGKRADILLINGNPLKNISDTRNIKVLIKGGTIYQVSK